MCNLLTIIISIKLYLNQSLKPKKNKPNIKKQSCKANKAARIMFMQINLLKRINFQTQAKHVKCNLKSNCVQPPSCLSPCNFHTVAHLNKPLFWRHLKNSIQL